MTIEEKAKRYDEAIKIAKSKIKNDTDHVLYEKDIVDIFSELKDNDDEKIRKKLISFVENWKNYSDKSPFENYPIFTSNNNECNKILNWLEKQKEHISTQNKKSKNVFSNIEDDVRRRSIIQVLEYARSLDVYNQYSKVDIDKNIAWLEKQKEIDKMSYEIAEKEKYDFVSGQYIECRKSFDVFKEENSYWFEYVGNDNYIGRSDNILNQKFHITPRQLYSLFTKQHCPIENNVNEETNAPTEYGKYVDECLNETAKHFFSEGKDKYTVADLFYAGIKCKEDWLEKQDKQKSNPYSGVSFEYNGHIWGMCARDGGVEIGCDKQLIAYVDLPQEKK